MSEDIYNLKVLLVDDHPAMRFAISALLGTSEDMELVGEADNAGEALSLAQDKSPDLTIVDLQLKGSQSGIELCRELKSLPEPPKILVYTAHNSREHAHSALLSGADGFMHKGLDYEELPEAVRRTCAGERPWLMGFEEKEAERQLQTVSEENDLTSREHDILDLVHKGRTNPEIATKLSVSLSTVKTHVGHILRKTGRNSRREL
jgi:NarL family two-component system response regulator LiaR